MASLDGQDGESTRPMNPPSEHEKQVTLQETGEGRSANEISCLAEKQDMTVIEAVQSEKKESSGKEDSSDLETYDIVADSNDVVVEEQNTSPFGSSRSSKNSIEEEQDVSEILHQSKKSKESTAGIGWYISVCVFILIVAFLSYKIITLESSPTPHVQIAALPDVPTQQVLKTAPASPVVSSSVATTQNQSLKNQSVPKNLQMTNLTSQNASSVQHSLKEETPDADAAVGDLADRLGK